MEVYGCWVNFKKGFHINRRRDTIAEHSLRNDNIQKFFNPDYRETFETPPIIAFRKSFSLKQIIVTSIIRNNKKYL